MNRFKKSLIVPGLQSIVFKFVSS